MLERTTRFLKSRGIDTPRLDTELLLCKHMGVDRLHLYLSLDQPLGDAELAAMRPDVSRRGSREPLYWILGERGFHAIELHTPVGVLVPRPDTETLVEAALAVIPRSEEPVYIADVGCGTGAIGLALAVARPEVRLFATDVSPAAIAATKENVRRLGLERRVAVLLGDLLSPIPPHRPVDWVLSNPPYIPSGELDGLQPEVSQHEPRLALDGGADGLDVYRRLIPQGLARARQGVLVELGMGQADAVASIFRQHGLASPRRWSDLGGVERVVGGPISP
ncbi:MAG: peptide chain release factor N(5)-glutamine methyltransferase [Deltaproteobacteria bacterium]|nr:peptide chain release factor N(5)-glutamine methyltransferase [Deltaproteobacteria bacterium]